MYRLAYFSLHTLFIFFLLKRRNSLSSILFESSNNDNMNEKHPKALRTVRAFVYKHVLMRSGYCFRVHRLFYSSKPNIRWKRKRNQTFDITIILKISTDKRMQEFFFLCSLSFFFFKEKLWWKHDVHFMIQSLIGNYEIIMKMIWKSWMMKHNFFSFNSWIRFFLFPHTLSYYKYIASQIWNIIIFNNEDYRIKVIFREKSEKKNHFNCQSFLCT